MPPTPTHRISEQLNLEADRPILHYLLEQELGGGGMGVVWLARNTNTNQRVALKFISSYVPGEAIKRFRQEAMAAANLKHPNLLVIYDFFQWGTDHANRPRYALAMEYMQGTSLDTYKPADIPEILDLMSQSVMGLSILHDKGIIHRDLKTSNIFLEDQETLPGVKTKVVKIGDFGLVQLPSASKLDVTSQGYFMGSPLYAPPEQFADASTVDARADLYAVGVILYELLTGKLPPTYDKAIARFEQGDSERGFEWLWNAKLSAPVPPPGSINPQVPPPLDELVLKLLAAKPEDRYQSALDLYRDLTAIEQALTQSPFVTGDPAVPAATSATRKPKKTSSTQLPTTPLPLFPDFPGAIVGRGGKALPKGRHLSAPDLMLARNPDRVRALFAALNYKTLATELDPAAMQFGPALPNIVSVHFIADYDTLQILLFEVDDLATTELRKLAQNMLNRGGEYLLVAVKPEIAADGDKFYRQLVLLCPQRTGGSSGGGSGSGNQFKLHRLTVTTRQPTRHALDVLEEIALPPPNQTAPTPAEIYKKLLAAFNVEAVTKKFYRRYYQLYVDITKKVRAANQSVAEFNDLLEVKSFVQRLFGRLMFLYFLQKKGWLADDPNFLSTQFKLYDGKRENYYRQFLVPLFFRVLASRTADRNADPGAGPIFSEAEIPYLNGGLFELGLGQEYENDLHLQNLLFAPNIEGGILAFFNSYDFTVEENTPVDNEVALDPEMLGKVFENLLEEDERGQSGTFYTPRAIVHFITRRALAGYLADKLAPRYSNSYTAADLTWLFEPFPDEATPKATFDKIRERLPLAAARIVETALSELRVLDPAVGSGAFPVGLLQDMVEARKNVELVYQNKVEPGSYKIAQWKREYISQCLYGVDIKPAAIEIAKLRLWLSLVVDLNRDNVEPLPNLDYKLLVGNSLLDNRTRAGTGGATTATGGAPVQQLGMALSEFDIAKLEFEDKRQEWFDFDGSAYEKRARRNELWELERKLFLLEIEEGEQNLKHRLGSLVKGQFAELKQKDKRYQKAADAINVEQSALDEMKKGVREGRRPFFDFRLYFSDVFGVGAGRGGFDLIIGNPPYVRQEQIKELKPKLELAYPSVYAGTADLYVYFYARGFDLLREGGRLAYITSNKFFRADYGRNLRRFFADKVKLETVIDFGDLPIFEATAYPTIMISVKRYITYLPKHSAPAANSVETLTINSMEAVADLEKFVVANSSLRVQTDLNEDGWNLGNIEVQFLITKLKTLGTPLKNYANTEMYYGIKTGLNEAFIIDEATRTKLVEEDANSADIIKPHLKGKDVRRYRLAFSNRYIILTQRGIDIKKYPAIKRHLDQFKEALEKRQDKGEFYWELRSCSYYAEFEKPKIIYPEVSYDCRFAYDINFHYYTDKTTSIIPTSDKYLLGVLNSKLSEFFFRNIMSSVRGGYLMFSAIYVEQMPIATPTNEQRARIEELANNLIEKGLDVREAVGWQAGIDRIVYEIYGLTSEEIALVEGKNDPSASILE
jgi:adenine-specific DNA-methyltransferase